MKLTFSFQTLILAALAAALVLATGFWGATVYRSLYAVILDGFDRKLLALSGGAAALTDGDGHADYQRPYRIVSLQGGDAGRLLGYDAERGRLVDIDPEDGGAIERDLELPAALSAIALDPVSGRIAGLALGGGLLYPELAAALPEAAQPMEPALDGILYLDGVLYGRRGRTLAPLDGGDAQWQLDAEVVALVAGPAHAPLLGLAADEDPALLVFTIDGKLQRRLPLDHDGDPILSLAHADGRLWAASDRLLEIDVDSGLASSEFEPGFYSEAHPFFQRHVPAYRWTRETAGLTFLYTEVHLGGDQIRYILDGSTGDDHSLPGTLDTVPPESVLDVELAQARGQAFVSAIREWEEWGLIKVSAQPIFDSRGQVVALAGADVDIGVIRDKTRTALFAVIFVGIGGVLLAGSVSLRVSRGLTRPLREIKDSALRIAAGYLGTRIASGSKDDVGLLASSLDTLSARLDAQARQARAYQEALTSGRMQVALQRSLEDLAGQAAPGWIRAPEDKVQGRAAALLDDGRGGLLWSAEDDGDPLRLATRMACRQRIVSELLRGMTPREATDALFQTDPDLHWALTWDASGATGWLRQRGTLELTRLDAAGAESALAPTDQMELALGDAAALRVDGWVLQRMALADGEEMPR